MTGYTTGTGNELTNDGTWTYTYDADGNLTEKSQGPSANTWTYGYNNNGQMIWAKDSATPGGTVLTLATYVYDALGNQIEEDVWTSGTGTVVTRFGWDGSEIWADLNSSNPATGRWDQPDPSEQCQVMEKRERKTRRHNGRNGTVPPADC